MHTVYFSRRSQANLESIFRYIAKASSAAIAQSYVERIRQECFTLGLSPHRGTERPAISPGLRIIGFDRSATIAFRVRDNTVTIIAIFYRGRNVRAHL